MAAAHRDSWNPFKVHATLKVSVSIVLLAEFDLHDTDESKTRTEGSQFSLQTKVK